jgi:hypothetical protein
VELQFLVHSVFGGVAPEEHAKAIGEIAEEVSEHGLLRAEDVADGRNELAPGVLFGPELRATAGRELVEPCAPVLAGDSPLRLDPSAPLEPVERGVEGSLGNGARVERTGERMPDFVAPA